MDLYFVMLALGLVGSFFSGLLGIGGAIINYPLLLFIPSLLGVAHFTGQEVSTISMFQVLFASFAGVIAFRRNNREAPFIHKGLVKYMGISTLIGSLLGGVFSRYLTGNTINFIYGILAIIAVILMLMPSKVKSNKDELGETFNKSLAIISAFTVGIVAGIVGAGGAFILIPIMLTVFKLPVRATIATSLAIVFVSAIGGVIGKLTTGIIPVVPIIFTVIGSLIGAPFGAKLSTKLNVIVLRYGLAILISLTTIKIWSSLL